MAEKGYQGWKNYETFALALWIDNDRDAYETAKATAFDVAHEAEPEPKMRKRWPKEKHSKIAIFAVADALKEWIEEQMPELEGPWGSLLQSAFEEIDWTELAEHYLSKE